jgi:beta-galactosidase GanA
LNGGTFSHWQVIGNLGGENFADKVRGPYNEGGLYVERIGAHLPGFSTAGWTSGATCNPLQGIPHAGIMAYRTIFNLNLPVGADLPLALKVTLSATTNYRTLIYINGWQFGRVLNGVQNGPQDTFPVRSSYSIPQLP